MLQDYSIEMNVDEMDDEFYYMLTLKIEDDSEKITFRLKDSETLENLYRLIENGIETIVVYDKPNHNSDECNN